MRQDMNAPGSLGSSYTIMRFIGLCASLGTSTFVANPGVRVKQRLAGSGFINTQQPQSWLALTRATRRRRALRFSFRLPFRFPFCLQFSSSALSSIDALMVSAPLFDSCMSCFAHDLIKLMTHSDEN
jgi:hypothetical protein